jgi:hypothetical protein
VLNVEPGEEIGEGLAASVGSITVWISVGGIEVGITVGKLSPTVTLGTRIISGDVSSQKYIRYNQTPAKITKTTINSPRARTKRDLDFGNTETIKFSGTWIPMMVILS